MCMRGAHSLLHDLCGLGPSPQSLPHVPVSVVETSQVHVRVDVLVVVVLQSRIHSLKKQTSQKHPHSSSHHLQLHRKNISTTTKASLKSAVITSPCFCFIVQRRLNLFGVSGVTGKFTVNSTSVHFLNVPVVSSVAAVVTNETELQVRKWCHRVYDLLDLHSHLQVDLQGVLLAWDGVLVLQVSQRAHGHGISDTHTRLQTSADHNAEEQNSERHSPVQVASLVQQPQQLLLHNRETPGTRSCNRSYKKAEQTEQMEADTPRMNALPNILANTRCVHLTMNIFMVFELDSCESFWILTAAESRYSRTSKQPTCVSALITVRTNRFLLFDTRERNTEYTNHSLAL